MSLPYDIVTELFLGSLGWVDLTATGDVRQTVADSGGGITITRTVPADGQFADPSTADLVLNNGHGYYSPRNPRSPYYGLLSRNTPIRTGLRLFADDFARTASNGWANGWSTAGTAANFAVASGKATHAHPIVNNLQISRRPTALRDVEQVVSVSTSAAVTGAALVTGLQARYQTGGTYYWLRVEFNAGASTVTLKISKAIAGVLTDLAILGPVPGLSYTAGQFLRARGGVVGDRLSISVWNPATSVEPADWMLSVVDTSVPDPGLPGLQTWVVSGNTNSPTLVASFDNYEIIDRRAWMEVSQFPTRWALSGKDVWAPIQAAGILQRLSQGAKPLRSALYREIMKSSPAAYWPLEDPADSPSAGTPIAGGTPMEVFGFSRFTVPGSGGVPEPAAGLPVFGSGDGIPGSAPVIDLAQGGVLHGLVPVTTGNGWRLEFVMIGPRDKTTARIPMQWKTNGTWALWQLQIDSGGVSANFGPDDGTGTELGSASTSFSVFDGLAHHYRIEAIQVSGAVYAEIVIDGTFVAQFDTFISGMVGSAGRVVDVVVNPLEEINGAESMPILGHVAVWNPYTATGVDTASAAFGHRGELAADRFERLCGERGIPVAVVRDPANPPDSVTAMGPQRPAKFLDLLRECVDVDQGVAFEDRGRLGLVLRTGRTLYNQTPVALSYGSHIHPPFAPVDDDRNIRNDVTVTRPDGGSAQDVQETGPLNVQEPADDPQGVGRYDVEYKVPVATNTQLPDQAGWRRHLGTVDEARYPQATIKLHAPDWLADEALTSEAVAVDTGDVVTIDDLPDWLPPGPAGILVLGSVESIDAYERSITWSAVPSSPYTVATVDGDERVPLDGATLAATLVPGDATMSLATTAESGLWVTGTTVTNPTDFPLQFRVGADCVTVSGISGTSSPQPATITSGVTRSWAAGTEVDVWLPTIAAP
jgi:hypothetical protein